MATKLKIARRGDDARKKLIKGADFAADCVKDTLGPYGRNWVFEKGRRVTNDGVSVARELELKDETEQLGLTMIREAAIKTNDMAGDGTTTAMTLAQAILKEASRFLGDDTRGISAKKTPIEIIRQVEKEKNEIIERLQEMSERIETRDDLIKSAKVSVEDDELAEMIGGTQWDLGRDGIILAEETAERTSSVEKIKGLRIDNGLGTSIVMNNQEKQALELSDTHVVLTNHIIKDFKPLKNLLDNLVKTGVTNLVIVARAFTPEAIQLCMENIHRGGLKIYPINAPYTDQAEIMKDLAAVLGGTFFHDEERNLEDMNVSDVGYADRVFARRYDAIFTGKDNEKTQERVDARVKELTKKISGEQSEFEKKNLERRVAQLTNGFALVKIGALSDTERKYKKDKAEDAVHAVRAAFQEGVVPGAGIAFKDISDQLPDTYILKRPLLSIYEQIVATAPKDFVIEDWVKDPVKVLRVALDNACSVAVTLATAAGSVATERDKPTFVQQVENKEEE